MERCKRQFEHDAREDKCAACGEEQFTGALGNQGEFCKL